MKTFNTRIIDKKNLLFGSTGAWEIVVGMEVHIQIKSTKKLFSESETIFGADPNSIVSFFDAAMPGTLPVVNFECICQAVKTGLGLNSKINLRSIFDRKNYFYPDLPQGYQISQFYHPIAESGKILISVGQDLHKNFENIEIRIDRLHLEQDSGKLLHDPKFPKSFLDLNRSGIALMEIVLKPDIRSSHEAKLCISKLRNIVRYLETSDGNMDEGSMRVDINVSIHRPGDIFGTPCEIKNVNSIRFIGQAIDYEAHRQISILENGNSIIRETRLFDPEEGKTRSMRKKENMYDYRYFPDPDLLPIEFDQNFVDNISKNLPELPDQKKIRLINQYKLSEYDASILTSEKSISDYFESTAPGRDPKIVSNWIINDLMGSLNKKGLSFQENPITSKQLGSILDLLQKNVISRNIAKNLFEIIWNNGGDPELIVKNKKLEKISDEKIIEKFLEKVFRENVKRIEKIKEKPALIRWLVGEIMKLTQGKADPKIVNFVIEKKIKTL